MNIIQFWKLRCEIFRQIHKKELTDELGEFAIVNMDGDVVNRIEESPLPVTGSAVCFLIFFAQSISPL